MRIIVPVGVLCLVVPLSLAGFREGPVPNVSGGFGDPTCRSCHFGNDLNDVAGSLTLTGVPPTYTPGRTYAITVTLRRKDLRRGGFELAARFSSGEHAGRQAGTWRISGGSIQTVMSKTDAELVFVQHTLEGTAASASGSIIWTMEWNAPEEGAPVQFNVAANASNDDNSPLGDFIYTAEVPSKPRR